MVFMPGLSPGFGGTEGELVVELGSVVDAEVVREVAWGAVVGEVAGVKDEDGVEEVEVLDAVGYGEDEAGG